MFVCCDNRILGLGETASKTEVLRLVQRLQTEPSIERTKQKQTCLAIVQHVQRYIEKVRDIFWPFLFQRDIFYGTTAHFCKCPSIDQLSKKLICHTL